MSLRKSAITSETNLKAWGISQKVHQINKFLDKILIINLLILLKKFGFSILRICFVLYSSERSVLYVYVYVILDRLRKIPKAEKKIFFFFLSRRRRVGYLIFCLSWFQQ